MNAQSMPVRPIKVDITGVETCYDVYSLVEAVWGVSDFAQGRYAPEDRDNRKGYNTAQFREAERLLDEIECYDHRSSMMEIGCGYGRILRQAKQRRARTVGITVSKPQQARCSENGLDVRLMNYRDIPREWDGCFTGVVANGPIEHFVQPLNVWNGEADALYREMFHIVHRVLQPGRRFVTTTIHFRDRAPDPQFIVNGTHKRGTYEAQVQSLFRNFHGWYPSVGQFAKCAAGKFTMINETDGTDDYRRTSEFWLYVLKMKLLTSPKVWSILGKALLKRDAVWDMHVCWSWDQAWNWQFRPNPITGRSPMILLRNTWQRVD